MRVASGWAAQAGQALRARATVSLTSPILPRQTSLPVAGSRDTISVSLTPQPVPSVCLSGHGPSMRNYKENRQPNFTGNYTYMITKSG